MKKLMLGALVLAALLPSSLFAQAGPRRAITLFGAFDLDGEAADADQVIVATTLVDSGTSVAGANWTIVAQPDTCRLLNITVVDTNLNTGTLTVAGTGCLGEARSCAFAFTVGDDSGVKTLTCTDGEGAYFSTVSTVTTGVMTGESDETFALGYGGVNSVNGWAVSGALKPIGPNGENGVDAFGSYDVAQKVTTAGSSSTTISGVTATDAPFNLVSVGDTLLLTVGGRVYERYVVTRNDADSVVVDSAVTIPAAGINFKYKKLFFSTNPADDMSFGVAGYKSLSLNWSVDANANTGGVITLFQCTFDAPQNPALWITENTTTVNSGATQVPTSQTVDLTTKLYNRCRFGIRFGTGDDADGAAEDINAQFVLSN